MTGKQSTQIAFDSAGIRGQSARVGSLGDELAAIRQTWAAATADAAPALGLAELIGAFGSMRQAWLDQFSVCADAMSALSDRLAAAAAGYAEAEAVSTDNARSVGQ
jgi:hypothetical protein